MTPPEQDRNDLTDGGYVRFHYAVPAHRGGRVAVDGKPGVIVGFENAHLRVLFDGETEPVVAHPTWRVEYLDDALAPPAKAAGSREPLAPAAQPWTPGGGE